MAAKAHRAQPRGATPRPRSGEEAGRTPCPRGSCQEELPHVRGQGRRAGGCPASEAREQWPRVPGCDSPGGAERSYPTSKVRGGGRKELSPAQGQGQGPGGATPWPRSSGCTGAGGPRGAIPCSRSGGVAVRRYPLSKERSSGCTLLEQPWRDTPHPR